MDRILLGQIILAIAAVTNAALARKSWQRRPAPGAAAFGWMTALVALYAAANLIWMSVFNGYAEAVLHVVRMAATAFIPVAWFCFALQYSGREAWLAPGRIALWVAVPVVSTFTSLDVVWPEALVGWEITASGQFQFAESAGPWYYVHTAYTFFLFIAGLVVLLRTLPFSGQSITMLVSIVVTLSIELMRIVGIQIWGSLPGPSALAVGLTISALTVFWGISRYKFLDVVPLAHHVVVEGMNDALLVMDGAGRIGDLNPEAERVLELKADQVVGRSIDQLLGEHPELVLRCREQREARMEIARGLGDHRRYFDAVVSPLYDRQGRPAGTVLMLHDVTERKQREEELRRAWQAAEADNRAKNTFLSNASHQLRAPLSAVIGYSDVLQSEAAAAGTPEPGAVLVPDLQKIAAAGHNLLAVLTDILDLAKAEAGRTDLYLERFDLSQLVQEVVEELRPAAEGAGNRIELQAAGDGLGVMYADRAKVQRILYSALHNACKFTENGRITVAAGRQRRNGADWVRLQVTDTGIGMDRQQLESLFVPFAQNRAQRLKHGGAGLGMALSQRWCQAMGGEVQVDSQPSRGTTVTIWLPATVAEEAGAAAAAGAVENATVLVLDDDKSVQKAVAEALRPAGYRVVAASGGQEGLRLARELQPHAVLLDTMMPDVDGWAVLSALRADPDLAGVPVIMLASQAQAGGGAAGGRGTLDTLVKPLDAGRLLKAVRESRRFAVGGAGAA